jgi:hypothetical protein
VKNKGGRNTNSKSKPGEKAVFFWLLNNLRVDEQQCFWIVYSVADEDMCDIGDDLGQMATEVKIALPMSLNVLDKRRGVRTMKGIHLKSEIAQRELSDLGRRSLAL